MFVRLPAEMVAWIEGQDGTPSFIVAEAVAVYREMKGGPTSDVSERLLREAVARLAI